MENNKQEKNTFSYSYSAKEQAEIMKIRNKYTPSSKEEDKMARLRKLDASVTSIAQAVSLAFGVIGVLILGFGMSLCLSELGPIMGLSHISATVIGIIAGVIGGVIAAFAYPIYNIIVRERQKELAPEIIRLTDELLK